MWNPISWLKLLVLSTRQEGLIFRPRVSGLAPIRNPEDYGLRNTESVMIRSRDNVMLDVWHRPPDPTPPSPVPHDVTFLVFHGNTGHWGDLGPRPGASDYDRLYRIRLLEAIVRAGAGFIAPSMRGYGKSEAVPPSEEGFARDVDAILDYVFKKAELRPRRIIVFGESLGAAVALMAASAMTSRGMPPAVLALVAPFSSMTDMVREKYPELDSRQVYRRLHHPFDNMERIGQLKADTRVYVAHGRDDHFIPASHSERLLAVARTAGLKVTESIPAGGHTSWDTLAAVNEVMRLYRGL